MKLINVLLATVSIASLGISTQAQTFSLTLLHTNNVNGRRMPVDGYDNDCELTPDGGADCLGSNASTCKLAVPLCVERGHCSGCSGGIAAHVKKIKDVRASVSNPNLITVDVANYYFGSLWYQQFKGTASNDHIRSVDGTPLYDVMGMGTAEFFEGDAVIAEILKDNPIPRIMANYKIGVESPLHSSKCQVGGQDCIQPYVIITRTGRNIAFIGVTSRVLRENASPSEFVTVEDAGDTELTVRKTVFAIHEADPTVNIIVVVSSALRKTNVEIAERVEGIDVILATNEGTAVGDAYPLQVLNLISGNPVLIGKAGNYGSTMGQMDLVFDTEGLLVTASLDAKIDDLSIPIDIAGNVDMSNVDSATWTQTKTEMGIVNNLIEQDVGETTDKVFGVDARAEDLNFQCASVVYTSEQDGSCENPISFGQFVNPNGGLGSPCCPFPDSTLACASASCSPDVDSESDDWAFPPNDACCPNRLDQNCCDKTSYWNIAGCKHSDCTTAHLATDALLHYCQDCDVGLSNAGGFYAEIEAGRITYGDILSMVPFQNTLSAVTITGPKLLEILNHSVEQYLPQLGMEKLLHLSGMRMAWDPSLGVVLKAEVCKEWNRLEATCVNNIYEDIMEDPSKTYKVIMNSYMRGGGDGYDMIAEIEQSVELSIDWREVIRLFLGDLPGSYQGITEEYIADNCVGFHVNFVDSFEKFPKCRLLKADDARPFKCSRIGLEECLSHEKEDGTDSHSIPGIQLITNGTCDECSGFGRCNEEGGFICECLPTLVDGFDFPRQYRDYSSDFDDICAASSVSAVSGHRGLVLTKGEACEQLAIRSDLSGATKAVIGILAFLNVAISVYFLFIIHRYSYHAGIKAAQPRYLRIMAMGGFTAGAFCIVCILEPSDVGCNAIPLLGCVTFALLLSPLILKSQMVHTIFNAKKLKRTSVSHRANMLLITMVVLVEMALCFVLSLIYPMHPMITKLDPLETDDLSYSIICGTQDSIGASQDMIWGLTLLALNSVLIVIGLYFAVLIRNVISAFNESKVIALAVYNITLTSAILIPNTFSSGGNPSIPTLIRALLVTALVLSTVGVFAARKTYTALYTSPKLSTGDLFVKSKSGSSSNPASGMKRSKGPAPTAATSYIDSMYHQNTEDNRTVSFDAAV